MVRISTASLVLLVVLAYVGEVVPVDAAGQCLKRNAQGVATEFVQSGQAYKDFANKAISCDKCSDEKMDIQVGPFGATITSTLIRRCTSAEVKAFDCKTTKRPGRIFYKDISSNSSYSISKCNPKLMSAISKSVDERDTSGAYLKQLASEDVRTAAAAEPPPINMSTPEGISQVARELAAGTGIEPADAEKIVKDDPQAAIKAINAISTKSEAEAKTAVQAIGLNPNLVDKAALQAVLASSNGLPDSNAEGGAILNPDGTFRQTTDTAVQQSIAAVLSPMCYQQGMGGCGNVCNTPYANQLTCGANNPGALTFTSWQAQYGGRPCGLPNNTTCFDSVEGGIAAQANLLMTSPRYFGSGNNTILGAFCNGYSTSNCAPYAAFISAQTGIPMNQTIDPQNTQQIAAIMMASSRYENGRGVIYTPEQLERGLKVLFGGEPLPTGTPGYVPSTVYGTNGGVQYSSPFNFNPSAPQVAPMAGYGSPFAQASPVPISQPVSTPQPSPTTTAQPQGSSPIIGTQQPTSTNSNVANELEQALYGGTTSSGVGVPASITSQPKTVSKGNPITVSWTSLGMQVDPPCRVFMGNTEIARRNSGSIVVPTSDATRTGSLVFSLSCTTASGANLQRTTATFVQ